MALSLSLDSLYYQKVTLSAYNFVKVIYFPKKTLILFIYSGIFWIIRALILVLKIIGSFLLKEFLNLPEHGWCFFTQGY